LNKDFHRVYNEQVDKDDDIDLPSYNFNAVVELDKALNTRLTHGKSALSNKIKNLKEEDAVIPEYFVDTLDVRTPSDVYVQHKLDKIVEEVFEQRLKVEKNLTK
jgi:hypothetical protein